GEKRRLESGCAVLNLEAISYRSPVLPTPSPGILAPKRGVLGAGQQRAGRPLGAVAERRTSPPFRAATPRRRAAPPSAGRRARGPRPPARTAPSPPRAARARRARGTPRRRGA